MNIVFYILLFISFAFIFMNIYFSTQIKEINKTLELIRGGNFNIRLRFYSSNKDIRNLGINLNAIIDEFQRITEKKEYLEDSRKKMLANISHDLRTPLTSILGYLEAIKKDLSLSEEDRNKFMDIVFTKAEKLYSILEEFFEISKIEAEDVPIKIEKVNLTNILQEVLAEFYQQFVNEKIEPIIDLPKKDLFVWGDYKAINRILSNLVVNALKYGKGQGPIGVRVVEQESKICIEIWNGGRGIDKKDIPYIFDRLYTGESSRSGKLHGSGLGLAIVKKLVNKLDGEVSVESIPFEKTTFKVVLPPYKKLV